MNPAEQLVQQDGHVLGAAAVPPQGPPQLPPQMFTTAAQLLDLTDSRYLSRIRDLCVSQPHFKTAIRPRLVLNIFFVNLSRKAHAGPS